MACFHFLNGDEINADELLGQTVFHTIPSDGKKKAAFLRSGKCLDGTPIGISGSVFHLKKYGNLVFLCNYIHLPSLGCHEICFNNLVLMFLEIPYGQKFRPITRGS